MILRNSQNPKGKDLGPAMLFSPAIDMRFLQGPGTTGVGPKALRIRFDRLPKRPRQLRVRREG